MLVDAIVSESVLLPNGALGFIKLTLEEYHACTKMPQYKIASDPQSNLIATASQDMFSQIVSQFVRFRKIYT